MLLFNFMNATSCGFCFLIPGLYKKNTPACFKQGCFWGVKLKLFTFNFNSNFFTISNY